MLNNLQYLQNWQYWESFICTLFYHSSYSWKLDRSRRKCICVFPGIELVSSALAVDRYLYSMSHLLNSAFITIIRISCRVTWSCAKTNIVLTSAQYDSLDILLILVNSTDFVQIVLGDFFSYFLYAHFEIFIFKEF